MGYMQYRDESVFVVEKEDSSLDSTPHTLLIEHVQKNLKRVSIEIKLNKYPVSNAV